MSVAIANIGGRTRFPSGLPVRCLHFTGVSGGTLDGSGNVTGAAPVTVSVRTARPPRRRTTGTGATAARMTSSLPRIRIPTPPRRHTPVAHGEEHAERPCGPGQSRCTPCRRRPVPSPGSTATPVAGRPQYGGGGAAGAPITGRRAVGRPLHQQVDQCHRVLVGLRRRNARSIQTDPSAHLHEARRLRCDADRHCPDGRNTR